MILREKRDINDASRENLNVHHLKFKGRKNRVKNRISLSILSLPSSPCHFPSSNSASFQSKPPKKPRKCIKLVRPVEAGEKERKLETILNSCRFCGGGVGLQRGDNISIGRDAGGEV